MPQYTDTQRSEAVTLYVEHGAAEAARRTGINKRSISRWASAADVSADRDKNLTDGADRLALQSREKREQLRIDALDKAADMLARMDQPHIDYKAAGRELHKVEYETARSGDVKNYAVSFAILLDKYRLEMGEATALVITGDMMDQAINEMRIELGDDHTA